jgi:MFS family permease
MHPIAGNTDSCISHSLLLSSSRPSLYIGICTVLWGVTSALTGITKNFAGIIACRVFIGLPEAAFYPGAIYVLSRWYTKKELAFRSAFLYAGLLISNAFGSVGPLLRRRNCICVGCTMLTYYHNV